MRWFSRLTFYILSLKYADNRNNWKEKVQKNAQIPFGGQRRTFRYEIVFRGILVLIKVSWTISTFWHRREKKQTQNVHLKVIFCSADLTRVNGSRIQLVLNANCFLGLTYGYLNKNFQEIKLYIIITLAQNTIVRLQSQIVRFSETLQTGLVTPHSWIKTKVLFLYMLHWIALHFLIHYLPLKNFAVCFSFYVTRALNTAETAYEWSLFSVVCLRLHILAEKLSFPKNKYKRVLLYSNDRLVGFSSLSLSLKKKGGLKIGF